MGSMLGMVVSGNLMQLVVFWELTSITSFLLIGYWFHIAQARATARAWLLRLPGPADWRCSAGC